MDKIINMTTVVIHYKGNETAEEVYKVVLNNIEKMFHAVAENPKLLEELRQTLAWYKWQVDCKIGELKYPGKKFSDK